MNAVMVVAYENLIMCPNSFVLMVQSLELQIQLQRDDRILKGSCGLLSLVLFS